MTTPNPDPRTRMITDRIAHINAIASAMAHERREQIHAGSDARDRTHTVNDWVAICTMHLGIAACDKDIPADLDRFEVQMVAVGALALAAVEWSHRRREEMKKMLEAGFAAVEHIPNQEDKS